MESKFKFLNTPITSFNIEGTNWCYLKCSACDRTIRKEHVRKRNDLDYNIFERLINEDLNQIDLRPVAFNFCGIYGDNLYHPDILNIFRLIKSRGSRIVLETNGSYKDREFWNELVSILTPYDTVNFSIDGLEDTNPIYRKGSSWKHIYEAMEIVGKSGVDSEWKYIVFKHNQHQIQEAQTLAKKLGIKKFLLRYSGRFLDNDPLLPDPEYVGLQQKHWNQVKDAYKTKSLDTDISIVPRCSLGRNIGITNEGLVIPCLTFHSVENSWIDTNRDKLSLLHRPFLEIVNDTVWYELKTLWYTPSKAPFICSKYCGMSKEEAKFTQPDRIKQNDYNYIDLISKES
jgi:MoaA/NifB/PqqE/SkfB family radical SAM enzyme